jgi:NTP pyrophosphatase (non-canonical NTP hydrolase)
METIIDALPQAELLAMLAEECSELAQAALKLRRVLDGSNPTPVSYAQCRDQLLEEAADVRLCMDTVHAIHDNMDVVGELMALKRERWVQRLKKAMDDK